MLPGFCLQGGQASGFPVTEQIIYVSYSPTFTFRVGKDNAIDCLQDAPNRVFVPPFVDEKYNDFTNLEGFITSNKREVSISRVPDLVILYALAGFLLGGLGGYINFRLAMDYLFAWRQSLSDYHAVLFTFLMITVTPQLLQAVIAATWAKKLKVLASTFVSLFIITAILKIITVTVNIFKAADIVVFLIPAIILLTQYLLALIPFPKTPTSSSVDS